VGIENDGGATEAGMLNPRAPKNYVEATTERVESAKPAHKPQVGLRDQQAYVQPGSKGHFLMSAV